MIARWIACALLAVLLAACARREASQEDPWASDLTHFPRPKPYLGMPERVTGKLPQQLSQTGAFQNVATLSVAPGLIPYDLIVPFWSDGAVKTRWVSIPSEGVRFSSTGEWHFPKGTVFVKNFDLPLDAADPTRRRRLETRLLVLDADGGAYGVLYKWRADGTDADLLPGSLTEQIGTRTSDGSTNVQTWYYPSRKDCLTCHTQNAGRVLGVKTRQLNRDFRYPSGFTENELSAWSRLKLFRNSSADLNPAKLPKLAATDDTSRSLEARARSYLDANCAHCHRPGGTVAYFDARYDTPAADQKIVGGAVLLDEGVDHPRVVAPNDIWRSIAYIRINTIGDLRMPPLARETIDHNGVALVRSWIKSLSAPPVLAPPDFLPRSGTVPRETLLRLVARQVDAEIHFTTDGSEPGLDDPKYVGPIRLRETTIVRARAYKEGYTHSITAQEVFVVAHR